ncbi:MAG: hypothetical protein LUC43_05420 [Burkholderiales bacterium]|nr:hypothetical protein [Burkholderiales bacterium]
MSGRILFFIIIGLIIYFGWRLSLAKRIQQEDREEVSERRSNVSKRANTEPSEKMVQCAYCGTFAVQSESVRKNGQWYCCPEHARKGPRHQ